MQYRTFGSTGMLVSRLCLGTMTFGDTLDEHASARAVDEAIDQGINFVDTADSYGTSEAILGKVLSGAKRDRVFLATKVYQRHAREGRLGRNSRENITRALESSLRRLRSDCVDLYQLHHPDPDTPIQETLSALDGIVRQGKARYVGVCNHYAWQMASMLGYAALNGWEPIVSYQANYSILDRQLEAEALHFCRRHAITIMCYSPLCGGILTGKYRGHASPPSGTRLGSDIAGAEYWQRTLSDRRVQDIVEGLAAIAHDCQLEMSQLAILWLLARSEVGTVILGGSRPEHYRTIYQAADRELPPEVVQRIDELSASRVFMPFANQPHLAGGRLRPGS